MLAHPMLMTNKYLTSNGPIQCKSGKNISADIGPFNALGLDIIWAHVGPSNNMGTLSC
jgi:hypothetical protein